MPPAVLLLVGRLIFHDRLTGVLERLEEWMSRNSGEMTAWIVFIIGLNLFGDALSAFFG